MLDTSALIAYLHGEPGGEKVPATTGDAVISAVNYAEAVTVLARSGGVAAEIRARLATIILEVLDFDDETAEMTGLLFPKTKPYGLSLGDRACLAAAMREGTPVMTAERSWGKLDLGIDIQLIR
jgi:PIN domain nuclease of toxin-antitoxin system